MTASRSVSVTRCLLLGLVVADGCGGDSGGPAAPATVATVAVSPPSATLLPDDTLRLTASALDSHGSAVSGKNPTWSSSATAVATVSSSGTVTALAPGVTSIRATVDGKSGSATITVNDPGPRIVLDAASASETIGSAGGSVSVTSADGVHYTLTVPPGALLTSQQITMTPVASVRKLGLSGGLVGGVDFQPTGLHFAKAAQLRIEIRQRPAAGLRLVGLTFEGDANPPDLSPAADSGTVALLPIAHFSVGVAGFGTTADVRAIAAGAGAVPTSSSKFYIDSLLVLSGDSTTSQQAYTDVLRTWFTNVVLPLFQNATTDAQLVLALSELHWWETDTPLALGITPPTPATYPNEFAQLQPIVAAKIGDAIDGNNTVCRDNQSFSALANVLFWADRAADLGVATPAFNLDWASIRAGLCVDIVLVADTLPDPLVVGTPYSLVTVFGVQFLQNGTPQDAAFAMSLPTTSNVLDIANPTGNTNLQGLYTTVVTPLAAGDASIVPTACLIMPGTITPTSICGSQQLTHTSVDELKLPGTLPDGKLGVPYSAALFPTGGNGTYAFSLASGQLPPGVNISPSGVFSGTPTLLGPFLFTVRVTSGGQTIEKSFAITIDSPPPAPLHAGAWEKDSHIWLVHCCGVVVPQNRGIRLEIYFPGDGTTHLRAFQPPVSPGDTPAWDVEITSTNGTDFTGASASIPAPFVWEGASLTVQGTELSNGTLSISWTLTIPGVGFAEGSPSPDIIPPG